MGLAMSKEIESDDLLPGGSYSIQDASELLRVSEPTLFRYMKDGKVKKQKHAGRTSFTRESLLDYLIGTGFTAESAELFLKQSENLKSDK